ncbi:isoprenoid synthase domain-containing protein [Lasiosphaeria ovina]|uniref:Terpene synthase n=1 Tax=Lasiosphaeria ovina TaxID=92902 RepID=A0AAE0KBI4_9PEZI|nr:isoprenoid synthase domain-containing protein [Lasiosphaeria ovina]
MASTEPALSHHGPDDGVLPPPDGEPHAALIAKLEGQVMHVPDMLSLFPKSWPSGGRNKYYKRLKARLDEIVQSVFPDEVARERALKSDFALLTSIWFPDAAWDDFYTCGLFSFWIFHCDDAMDDRAGVVSQDFSASCEYRKQVLDYTRCCLGLDPVSSPQPSGSAGASRLLSWFQPAVKWNPPCPSLPNSVFLEFAERVQLTTSKAFRELLHRDIESYLDHCAMEQRERMTGEMPDSLESYLRVRHHTSGIRCCGFLVQLGQDVRVPVQMMKSAEMQALWDDLTVLVLIENDILSAKKELAAGCVHNAIPVLYSQGQSLDSAIRVLVARLQGSRDAFDRAADSMCKKTAGDAGQQRWARKELLRYLDGLRTIATACIEFCKLAERYGNEKYLNHDGTMDVML